MIKIVADRNNQAIKIIDMTNGQIFEFEEGLWIKTDQEGKFAGTALCIGLTTGFSYSFKLGNSYVPVMCELKVIKRGD